MYLYDISELEKFSNGNDQEIVYIDQGTGLESHGIIVGTEWLDQSTVFVYIASPYDEENNKVEGNIRYKEIFVFDDKPNVMKAEGKEGGWARDSMLYNYGRKAGRSDKLN